MVTSLLLVVSAVSSSAPCVAAPSRGPRHIAKQRVLDFAKRALGKVDKQFVDSPHPRGEHERRWERLGRAITSAIEHTDAVKVSVVSQKKTDEKDRQRTVLFDLFKGGKAAGQLAIKHSHRKGAFGFRERTVELSLDKTPFFGSDRQPLASAAFSETNYSGSKRFRVDIPFDFRGIFVEPTERSRHDEKELATILAERLLKEPYPPSKTSLDSATRELMRRNPEFGDPKLVRGLIERYQALIPALDIWTRVVQPVTLREVADYLMRKFVREKRVLSETEAREHFRKGHEHHGRQVPAGIEKEIVKRYPELFDGKKIVDRELVDGIYQTSDARHDANYRRAIAGAGGERLFEDFNWLHVSHGYNDLVSFTEFLESVGMKPELTDKVLTVYPQHRAVPYMLRDRGYTVHGNHVYDEVAFERSVEKALRSALARRQKNGKAIMALDDGGTIVKVIREKFTAAQAKELLIGKDGQPIVNLVEVTQNGRREIDELLASVGGDVDALPLGFSSSARSFIKRWELSPEYARTCRVKAEGAMKQAGLKLEPDHAGVTQIGVVGAGAMGIPLAIDLARSGQRVHVTVYDKDPAALKELRSLATSIGVYITVADRLEDAVKGKTAVWGMTGKTWFTDKVLPLVDDGTTIIQGSSSVKSSICPRWSGWRPKNTSCLAKMGSNSARLPMSLATTGANGCTFWRTVGRSTTMARCAARRSTSCRENKRSWPSRCSPWRDEFWRASPSRAAKTKPFRSRNTRPRTPIPFIGPSTAGEKTPTGRSDTTTMFAG
jgi:hypothetical protein